MASEVATMQDSWQESWKEGATGWHDGEGTPYSGKIIHPLYHKYVYCQVV